MKRTDDALLQAVERLEKVLTAEAPGQEHAWVERVDGTLAEVEQVLRGHRAETAAPDGPFHEVDQTRPTLVRRVSELRRELAAEAGEAKALHVEVHQAAERGSAPDVAAIRRHVEHLLAGLRRLRDGETDVVLESIDTDLGAGD